MKTLCCVSSHLLFLRVKESEYVISVNILRGFFLSFISTK